MQRYLRDSAGTWRLATPEFYGCTWKPVNAFLPPCPLRHSQDMILNGEIAFLNTIRQVGWPPNWALAKVPKLWMYNLHYHDYLWDIPFPHAKAMVLNWIEQCPYGQPEVAWEPYPVSLRLTNWCAYLFGRHKREMDADPAFAEVAWHSIYRQATFLQSHLETRLLGNHLLENAVALAVAGSCFGGQCAADWLRRSLDILREQLLEQMLPDGGHFERSPMYHSRVLWCLLALFNTGQSELGALVRAPLERGLRALAMMCHPDGQIALLNDAAFAIFCAPPTLLQHSPRILGQQVEPPKGCFALSDSGYYGTRTAEGHYVICDYGLIGPDYIPGHAHGDIFSYELSYRGHRVVVDSGVSDYEVSDTRAYCRSTRAHNTVTIDSQDQCEFWAAFRVARRGRPHEVRWTPFEGGFRLEGWHDGYTRLRGKPKHARRVTWYDEGILLVRDEVGSKTTVEATSRIHLHPDCKIAQQDENSVEVDAPMGPVFLKFNGLGNLHIEEATYCPEFGLRVPNKALAWSARGPDIRFGYCIASVRQVKAFDTEHGATLNGRRYEF